MRKRIPIDLRKLAAIGILYFAYSPAWSPDMQLPELLEGAVCGWEDVTITIYVCTLMWYVSKACIC
jgi:hypothetical protein